MGKHIVDDYIYSSASFKRWADKRRSDPRLIEDAERAARLVPLRTEKKSEGAQKEGKNPASPGRGRSELITPNPVAPYMHLLSTGNYHGHLGSSSLTEPASDNPVSPGQRALQNPSLSAEKDISSDSLIDEGTQLC